MGISDHFGGIRFPQCTDALALHVAIGPDLICYTVDRESLDLREVSRLNLPAPVQYAWPHPVLPLLYVACSNRPVSKADDLHVLATVELDNQTGHMKLLATVPLPTRPIHLTFDRASKQVVVVYNAPSRITLHLVNEAGLAGEAMSLAPEPSVGVFPHQVLMLPSGKAAVVVARGNHARGDRSEEPGSLEFLEVQPGELSHISTVAPDGGHGFGPRHLAFHSSGRWAAISVERHNELHIFSVLSDRFASEPVCRISTLPAHSDSGHDQLSGTVQFHPSGRFIYVVNRHDTSVYGDGDTPSQLDGNNIAVFEFDEHTGSAKLIRHERTESIHVRTISLDASGQLLAAASILPALAHGQNGVEKIPARLSFFHCGQDGGLTLVRLHDMPNERLNMFWSRINGDTQSQR